MFMQMFLDETESRRSRQEIMEEHKRALRNWGNWPGPAFCFQQTVSGSLKSPPSKVQFHPNNRISIKDMQVDHIHHSKFLLCRVIVKSFKMTAVATVIEDPEGDVERLALYNWIPQSAIGTSGLSADVVTKFLPVGSILAIKNPYYKVTADSFNTIRCDNPGNVIFVDTNNKLLAGIKWATKLQGFANASDRNKPNLVDKLVPIDDFRLSGNKYFAANDFAAAAKEYSCGIELDQQNVTLHANRAEAYLRLRQFAKALSDAETALRYDPNHQKAILRKGKALCALKRYQESVAAFQNLLQKMKTYNPVNESVKIEVGQLLKHTKMLDSENRHCAYDYIGIVEEFYEKSRTRESDSQWTNERGPRLDHADYISDSIEIRSVGSKGRGWVAKCRIPEGTLLMVSKAFEIVYANEVPFGFNHDLASRISYRANTSELVTSISQKLLADPDVCREVYQLYAGPDMVSAEQLDEDSLCTADIERITKIVDYNSFGADDPWGMWTKSSIQLKQDGAVGLWILPSYFNHTCVDGNVLRHFLGDLMFIRSKRAISKGEELTYSYIAPSTPYDERSEKLASYRITCQCRLCKLDRSEPKNTVQRRAKFLETFDKSIKSRVLLPLPTDVLLIKELETMTEELRILRKDHPELDLPSLLPKSALALVYARNDKPRESLAIYQDLHDLSKRNGIDAHQVAAHIALRHLELGKTKKAKKWINISLRELTEPIRGKYKDDEPNWKSEAMRFAEKLSPDILHMAKSVGLL